MSSNGLILSQWDSFYDNPIVAPYLQFENPKSFSSDGCAIYHGGRWRHLTCGFGGDAEVEIARVQSQTTKCKIHDFAKSKKQAFKPALVASGEKFQFLF